MNAIIKICWTVVLAFGIVTLAQAAGETKRVCKNIKVHKKLEGTPVPEKKK